MKQTLSKAFLYLLSIVIFSSCTDTASDGSANDNDSATVSQASAVTDDWRLGVQFWTFRNFPFVVALEKADSAGVKFIEAFPGQALGGDFKDSFNINMSPESRTRVKQMVESKGMKIVAFGVTGGRDLAEWNRIFSFAKDMGIEYINSEPNKSHWGFIDSLSGVHGIKVAIHEHPKPNPYWHPDSVIAAMSGHPNLYACADLGHWGRSGLDVVDCLKKLEGRIIGVHLKDIKEMGNNKAEDVIVGTGVLKYPEIFSELKRQNFKGMMSIERENNWDNNMPDVRQTVQFYNEQVKALK